MQRVTCTPPLPKSKNCYACLPVEEIKNPSPPDNVTIVIQNPSLTTPPPKPTLTRWEHCLPQKLVTPTTPSSNSLELEVGIETTSGASHTLQALLDCRADGLFMDVEYAKANNIATRVLHTPIPVFNVDGTANEAGAISEIADVTLWCNGHTDTLYSDLVS